MKRISNYLIAASFLLTASTSFTNQKEERYSVKAVVSGLRNHDGVVQIAIYNSGKNFPESDYKNFYRKKTSKIENGISSAIFEDLPEGKYAISIFHDEDNDGKIKKGFILPKEGVGFSNYRTISPLKKPTFSGANFELKHNLSVPVKIIYLQ